MRINHWFAPLAMLAVFYAATVRGEFALRDGDTVVFLGDSITAARVYGKIIENYSLLRFPDRKVRFINAGWGGDTAAGGLKRLEQDVFAQRATVLIVAYGVNDIGWGLKADHEHKQIYLDSIRGIVAACKTRGVRVFICSAAVTGADPSKSEEDFLQRMCDDGMALARSLGGSSIDVQRTMRTIQKRVWESNEQSKSENGKESLHTADGVHLSELGQKAMAFAILKGLGAPAAVSSVTMDATKPQDLIADGCRVSDVICDADRVEFTRLDEGLPLNFGLFGAIAFRFIPVTDELNRYMLTVKNLNMGRYEIVVDDRSLGTFSNVQLDQGVNIASSTADGWEPGGPWYAQAWILNQITDGRSELATAQRLTGHYLPRHVNRGQVERQVEEINASIEKLQRTLARPVPYHFVIKPAKLDAKQP